MRVDQPRWFTKTFSRRYSRDNHSQPLTASSSCRRPLTFVDVASGSQLFRNIHLGLRRGTVVPNNQIRVHHSRRENEEKLVRGPTKHKLDQDSDHLTTALTIPGQP